MLVDGGFPRNSAQAGLDHSMGGSAPYENLARALFCHFRGMRYRHPLVHGPSLLKRQRERSDPPWQLRAQGDSSAAVRIGCSDPCHYAVSGTDAQPLRPPRDHALPRTPTGPVPARRHLPRSFFTSRGHHGNATTKCGPLFHVKHIRPAERTGPVGRIHIEM